MVDSLVIAILQWCAHHLHVLKDCPGCRIPQEFPDDAKLYCDQCRKDFIETEPDESTTNTQHEQTYEGFKNEATFAVAFCIKNNEKLLYSIRENGLNPAQIEARFAGRTEYVMLPKSISYDGDLTLCFKSLIETALNSVDWAEVHKFINE